MKNRIMMVFEVSGSDSMGRFIDGYCAELSATLWNDIINIVTSLLKPLLINSTNLYSS